MALTVNEERRVAALEAAVDFYEGKDVFPEAVLAAAKMFENYIWLGNIK